MPAKTVLLIPDVHAKPGDSLARLDALGAWLRRRAVKISKIIQIGDLWDFESLCTHDQQKPEWYQRNLKADLVAGGAAFDKIAKIALAQGLNPRNIVITAGNHEDRYDKWMASDNRLLTSGFPTTLKSLVDKQCTYIPFQQPFFYEGIGFAHYFVTGVMNRPHSGERPALSMLRTHHCSVVQGHKHTADWAEHTRPDGTKIYALVSGCFVNPNDPFSFAGAARKLWWTGCHLLHITKPGEFDIESISLERM